MKRTREGPWQVFNSFEAEPKQYSVGRARRTVCVFSGFAWVSPDRSAR